MKKANVYIVLLAGLTMLQACKKDLNKLPQNSEVAEVVITDSTTAGIALNGAYYSFANATPIKTSWQTHELGPAMLAGYLGYGLGPMPDEENMNANASFIDYWNQEYKLVNTLNGALKGVAALSD